VKHFGKYLALSRLDVCVPYSLEIPLQRIFPGNTLAHICQKTYTELFTAAPYVIAKLQWPYGVSK
jgi:hypothetical protein